MRNWLQNHVPAGVETEITGIDNLADYEKPLIAHYTVHGTIGTATERRLILPDEFFEAKSSALFPEPTRQTPVYFDHTERVVDAVRYKFPADCKLEAAPSDDSLALQDLAAYHVQSESQPGYVLVRRTYDLGASLFKPTDYPEIHTFFDKLAADDQRLIIIDKPSAK